MYFRITLTAPWPFLSLFSGISNMKGKNGPAFLDVSWSNSLTDSFKYLCGLATQYLVDLIAVAAQSRYNLRSRNATLLVLANAQCLPTDLVTEPFSRWLPNCVNCVNSLPAETRNIQSLTSFKTALKTYFLKKAFN